MLMDDLYNSKNTNKNNNTEITINFALINFTKIKNILLPYK